MKVRWNSKYTTISVYTVITFAVCLAMIVLIMKFGMVAAGLSKFMSVLSPVIWGLVIAFLLNPIMTGIEGAFKKLFERKKSHPKLRRGISAALAMIIGLALIAGLVVIIVPQLLDSIMSIFGNMQTYLNNIYAWVNNSLANTSENSELVTYINDQLGDMEAAIMSGVNDLIPKVGSWAVRIKDGAVGLLIGLKDFLIGFIVALYFLLDKEKFIAGAKKLTSALFPQSLCRGIFMVCDKTNASLKGFLSGKIMDSLIIGVICFVAMKFMKLEYPELISVTVGVTNIIPFFGPFIGAVPSALLLLLSAPSQTLPFIIMILALQQFDGNILGPYILGDSTGLPAFWVMFAIFIGGGLFGFAGMLLGVPLFAVLYTFAQEIEDYLLEKKGLPTDSENYNPAPPPEKKKKVHKSFRMTKG